MSDEREMKACPFCAEQILAAAIKCKHCGERLDGSSESKSEPEFRPLKPKSTWWVPSKGVRWVVAIVILSVGAFALGLGPRLKAECSAEYNGDVRCRFRNLGYMPGSICADVGVVNRETSKASRRNVCSDLVWPRSSQEVSSHLTDVGATCGSPLTWTDTCRLEVKPDQ
jgi:hypothetical protein